jgi:hypothetical protein
MLENRLHGDVMTDKLQNIKATDELMTMSLADFETPVIQGDYPAAEKVLQLLMHNQRRGKMEFSLRPADRKLTQAQIDTESYQVIEKIATLLTSMFSDIKYIVSDVMFHEFTLGKGFLADLFAASSYHNTDHIIRNLGLDRKDSYTKEDIRRFLMLYVPDSTFDLPWLKLANYMPSEVSRAYLGLISSSGLLMTEMSNFRLNELAKVAKELPVITYSRPENLELMSSGYFHVSNFNGPDKYEFKKWAVKNYQKFMQEHLSNSLQKSIATKVLKKPRYEKQRILIIHEHYRNNHAMYRCYHSLISALKNEYHVVGMSGKNVVDEIGKSDHDEFIEHEKVYDFDSVIKAILKLQPDIILYPSIGMSSLVPLLATLRLAPIQCACPGHPSSSRFKNIDYMLHNYMGVDSQVIQNYFTEKTIEMGSEMQPMTYGDFKIKEHDNTDKTIKVCVNGVLPKVTSELIDVCQKITAGTVKPIEFQFFLNNPKQDLGYYSGLSTLRRSLPNSKIHFYQDYNAYMNVLAQCKFAIPTLPFGGSNSNMDCLRIKLPKLYIADDRAFVGYTDLRIWQSLGIDIGFCHSIDNLVTRAIELIEDEKQLSAFNEAYAKFDLAEYDKSVAENKVDNRLASVFSKLLKIK